MAQDSLGHERRANENVKSIVAQIRPEIEEKIGPKAEVTAISYRAQQEGPGERMFINIDVGHGFYVHARAFKGPDESAWQLEGLKANLSERDSLEYFEGFSL